ncbi:MAG: zinc ribbon domain-containing protein [Chloroflexi bacterium]|nr:zinc ribbon domain-containing protein [Chloroflexota bacterium]
MPFYDYRCSSCQQKVSVKLSYAEYDTAQPNCPLCGSSNLKRVIGSEMGEDLGPEFNDVVERLESGESPESIEQTMPNVGGGESAIPEE